MSDAQIRLALPADRAARLDMLRGVATRTAYADYLLSWALDIGGPAGVAAQIERAAQEGNAAGYEEVAQEGGQQS